MHRWIISEDADKAKIADFLAARFGDEDKKGLKLLLNNGIRLNGKAAKPSQHLSEGDVLELYTEDTAYSKPSEIMYEDENIFIYNKQQDVSCYTNRDDKHVCLYDLAMQHMQDNDEYNMDTYSLPYICHGIDLRTGGLVIVAKDELIYREIVHALKERRIRKFYRCIVKGEIEKEAELHDYMLVMRDKFARLQLSEKPQRGSTPLYLKYKPLKTGDGVTLMEVEMITDHISQICAQLAKNSMPVIGDHVYGDTKLNKKLGVRFPALWADKLYFEVGKNNPMEYLDNAFTEAEEIGLPYFAYNDADAFNAENDSAT